MRTRNDTETLARLGQIPTLAPRGVRSSKNHGTEHFIMEVLR
jgi:hypothetical protein